MLQQEIVKCLIEMLLKEFPEYKETAKSFIGNRVKERRLLRGLMNIRMPGELSEEFLALQDRLLIEEREVNGIIDVDMLATTENSHIVLWKGDITRLNADAIVNAANSRMLGCFAPCHGCIDNAIHSAAGLQLRQECYEFMKRQEFEEPTGRAKMTKGYNLPSRYVLHTVGPIVDGPLTQKNCEDLANCYRSCLMLARANNLSSIAFCCISTGEYHFPQQRAAKIAVQTVNDFLCKYANIQKVIFNVFTQADWSIYKNLLC